MEDDSTSKLIQFIERGCVYLTHPLFVMQYDMFRGPKGHESQCERTQFAMQKDING